MASFEPAIAMALKDEGGYVDDPADRGGETYRGIARTFHPGWRGWAVIDAAKGRQDFPASLAKDDSLLASVHEFYLKTFWGPGRYGQINDQAVANEVFSLALTNPRNAHLSLQRACRALGQDPGALDGVIGPKTIAAANACRAEALKLAFRVCMGAYYLSLENPRYILGWLRRALRV